MPLLKGFIQSFEVKDIDSKSGTFVQAYTRYNVEDSDKDRGRKGMFSKTWRENQSRIRHLLNHDSNRPVGDPQKFWEDEEYAYVQSQIGSHTLGEDFKKMVESGLIKEASYGYEVIKANKLKDGTQELLEVKLWEVSSLTSWGANQFTPIISFQKGMNMNPVKDILERYSLLDSFCRNSTATDTTIKELLTEKDEIETYIKSLIKGTEAVQTLQPQPDIKDDEVLFLYASIENQLLKLKTA